MLQTAAVNNPQLNQNLLQRPVKRLMAFWKIKHSCEGNLDFLISNVSGRGGGV